MQNQPDYTKQKLTDQISGGSVHAFGQLYKKHYALVYARALKITRCADLAADLTQDVFLRIWEYRLRLKDVKCVERYLSVSCKNIAMDGLRRSARENRMLVELMYELAESEEHFSSQRNVEECYALLTQAIEGLPSKRKQILILCKLEGLSHSDVASRYGISTGTVNDHVAKAMRSIRKFFKCRDA